MSDSIFIQILTVIQDEILNMWWFFLLSILLVGVIKGYKLDLRIRDSINRAGFWGIPIAVAVGMVSPLCACGILPIVISLAMMGTPLAPLMALLVTSPVMGPDALLLTYRGLGGDWAMMKLVGAGILGLSSGVLVLWLQKVGYLAVDMVWLTPVYKEDGSLAPAAEIGAAHGIKVKRMQVVPRDSRLRFIFDRTMDAGNGLLDRMSNPRDAFHVVRTLNTVLYSRGAAYEPATVAAQVGQQQILGLRTEGRDIRLLLPTEEKAEFAYPFGALDARSGIRSLRYFPLVTGGSVDRSGDDAVSRIHVCEPTVVELIRDIHVPQ